MLPTRGRRHGEEVIPEGGDSISMKRFMAFAVALVLLSVILGEATEDHHHHGHHNNHEQHWQNDDVDKKK